MVAAPISGAVTTSPHTPARSGRPRPSRPPSRRDLDHARATRGLRAHEHELVPNLRGGQYEAFCADIAERGILAALEITRAGVVLDGRARLQAALELQLRTVPVRIVEPVDEREYVLRAALLRRDLNPSQRAALALELDSSEHARTEAEGRRRQGLRSQQVATLPPAGKTRDYVAELAGVSARTVQDAETVRQHDQELFARIKAGDLPAHVAARRVRRRLRDSTLATPPPLPDRPFELIYADPPWQIGSPDSAKAPENHYPTMAPEGIKQLRPDAADDAVLFLWAVNQLLPLALEVMDTWEFGYRTNLVWVKPSIGLGHWARNQHELLLVGVRGNISAPDPQDRPHSVIDARRGRHSQKPDDVYELIERAYPQLSKLEMFARRARPGWAAWGNEAPT